MNNNINLKKLKSSSISFNELVSMIYHLNGQIVVRRIMGLVERVWKEIYEPLSYVDTASIFSTLVRPKSRGWIRLLSANPADHPLIDPQYYSHPDDITVMLEG